MENNEFIINLKIYNKQGVLNPEALTIENSLRNLDYNKIKSIKMAKSFEFKIISKSESDAEIYVQEMCDKLLVNPTIEDYEIVVLKD